MLEVISLLGVVKNYLPHPAPGPFGLLATLQLSCQTAPVHFDPLFAQTGQNQCSENDVRSETQN